MHSSRSRIMVLFHWRSGGRRWVKSVAAWLDESKYRFVERKSEQKQLYFYLAGATSSQSSALGCGGGERWRRAGRVVG